MTATRALGALMLNEVSQTDRDWVGFQRSARQTSLRPTTTGPVSEEVTD